MKKIYLLIALILAINPQFAMGVVTDVSISNPSFEGGSTAGWTSNAMTFTSRNDHTPINYGSYHARIECNTVGQVAYMDKLPGVNAGGSLTFTIYAEGSIAATNNIQIYLEWYDNTNTIIASTGRVLGTSTTGSTYVQLSVTSIAPTSPAAVSVSLGVVCNAAMTTYWIDYAQISGPAVPEFNILLTSLAVFSSLVAISFIVRKRK